MIALDEIKARLEAATPGPWELANPRPDGRNMVQRRGYDLYGDEVSEMIIIDTNPSDAEFIAHSPETQAKLLDALEAVEALHRPVEATYFSADDEFSVTVCGTCFSEAEEIPERYPCPTIAAIAEALQ